MVKTALLSTDIETGSKLLEILDQSGVKIDVALWTVLPEYEDWRLVLSARRFDAAGASKAYRLIHESLDAVAFPRWKTPIIMILPMKDPLVRDLRRRFTKDENVDGMRLRTQTIGDRFIEDAYVYRIS